MTADQVKGKSFRGALRYNLEKVENKGAEILDSSFAGTSEKSIMHEVRMVRMQRPGLQKYFYHTSINFPVHENLSDELMLRIAHDYLNQNGFNQHQYVIFRHHDADHPHIHILVNRIGYDGSVVTDSQDYARSERVLRKLEEKYVLTPVISSREAKESAMTKNELEMMKRTAEPSAKIRLQVILKDTLKGKPTIQEFISALEKQHINVLFNQASTGFVSGISYGYDSLIFKGASLGASYKWSTIKTITNYEQERDGRAIREANTRTRTAGTTGAAQLPRLARPTQAGRDSRNSAQVSADNQESGSYIQFAKQIEQRLTGAGHQHGVDDKNAPFEHKHGAGTPNSTDLLGRAIDGLFIGGPSDYHLPSGQGPYLTQVPRKRKKRKRRRL